MTKHKYTILEHLSGQRLDKVLSLLCSESSRSQIQKAIKSKKLVLNGKINSKSSTKVKGNDDVAIIITDKVQKELFPKNISLDIVYEDNDLIVVNKNSDMTVHPGAGNYTDTLVNALLYHTNSLSDIGGEMRPGIVHRLDKNTSGLMLVAKNNQSHNHLAHQLERRSLGRKYRALVWGMIKPMEGVIDVPIGCSSLDRKKMSTVRFGGKYAITHYKTLEILHRGLFSIVECSLKTGRTHQIRVHLSHIGHSVVGDQTYGNNSRKINRCPQYLQKKLYLIKHQALHSFFISFIHPTSKKKMKFEKDIPKDYNELNKFIRKAALTQK